MALAVKISYKLNNIKKHEHDDIINHLKQAGLPYSTLSTKKNKIYKIITFDKKNSDKKINLILLKKIGSSYYEKGLNIMKVKSLIN